MERFYVPAHWAHGPRWVIHEPSDAEWFGFECIDVKQGLRPKVYLIPLPGHSRGHCGVAIEMPDGWLLHCGDATYPFYHDGHPDQPIDSPPDWLVNRLLGPHTARLKELYAQHGNRVQLITSHDPISSGLHRARQIH